MSRSGLLAVCGAWLGRPGADEPARAAFAGAARDPAGFAEELRSHGLVAVALETARRLDAPGPVIEGLRTAARGLAAHALAIEAAAAELSAAAGRRGLGAGLLKGQALDRHYGARGLRSFSDLDLLIEPGAHAGWEECLVSLGFAPMRPMDRTWHRAPFEVIDLHFKSSDLAGVIDVPEELSPVRLDLAGLLARAGRVEGLPFPVLPAEDELVLAACHGLGVHVFRSLVWLLDVAVLAGRPLDRGRLLSTARGSGADRLLYHALAAAAAAGLMDPPEELLAGLRPERTGRLERRLMERLSRGALPGRAEHLLALALPAPRGYKRTLVRRALLPNRRAVAPPGGRGGALGGLLRHAGRVIRLGTLALWG